MKRKVMISLVAVAVLGCILFLASPYIFVSSPKSSVLIVYFDTGPVNAIYVLEDKSMEAIVGEERWISGDDPDWPGTVRCATEEEGHWRKITDRKRIQLSDEQFQKLMGLAEYLDNCNYQYPIITDMYENVFLFYKGKGYYINYNSYDFSNLLHDDYEQYSNTKYVRELADLFIEYSPIPISLE